MLNSKNAPAKPLRRQKVYSNDVKKLRMQSSTPRLTALARLGFADFPKVNGAGRADAFHVLVKQKRSSLTSTHFNFIVTTAL